MSEASKEHPWGRVDETNTVYVREGDGERVVGQYPDGTAEEALAYFVRKYDDLEGQLRLLEQRLFAGTSGSDIVQTIDKLRASLEEAAAVGDLASLRDRARALAEKAGEITEQQRTERAEQKQEALERREAIVAEAERIAAQPEDSVRWKDASQAMETLFANWQTEQRHGPQIGKRQADDLWKRFRAARQTFDGNRRKYFAQVDATNKEVKVRKERLIEQAEALASGGADAIPQYRNLLDSWKAAGRANRRIDDQLWARFKAAGDVLYGAKAAEVAQTNEEFQTNLVLKEAILDEAQPILSLGDHVAAREALTTVQVKWDEVGRVPRESMRPLDARLRAIEDHVKALEEAHWQATNPETIARSEGLRGQLEASIAELTAEIESAKAAGDAKGQAEAEEKLGIQRSWLDAIG